MANKAKKTTLEVAVTTPVPEVLQALQAKIDSLKHISDTAYKVAGNGSLEGFGDITKETKIPNLIRAFSSISNREKAYHEAAAALGLDQYEKFSVNGGDSEAWLHDIKLRIAIINHKETLDKLNEYKEKFSKFLSEQDQKQMLLNELQGFLGIASAEAEA